MRTLRALLLALGIVLVVLLPSQAAQAAEYCVFTDPVYVAGHQVVPATRYCVPGP